MLTSVGLSLSIDIGAIQSPCDHNPFDKDFNASYSIEMIKLHELDARGLKCPLPVLKARKRLNALRSGDRLRVWADDPAGIIDFPHFCAEAGHKLLEQTAHPQGGDLYTIERK